MYHATAYQSPVGNITLACDAAGEHIVGLWITGQKYFGGTVSGELTESNGMPVFYLAKKWLDRYFAGKKPAAVELPLAPIGGEFRRCVWRLLCEIPYGKVATYGEIAKKAAQKMEREKMSGRAVGGAVGHNPISIMIPCHRVVGANGSLTGYAGGMQIKKQLLELEGVDLARLFVP